MNTAYEIAKIRAKMIARKSVQRAVELLTAAGADFREACHFVMNALRSVRVAA